MMKRTFPPCRIRLFLVASLARFDLLLYRLNQKLSASLNSLILILSKPRDLEELVKRPYQRAEAQDVWGGEAFQARGLFETEEQFVKNYLKGKKSCLVFQCGGGREAFALAKAGLRVKGIDSSPRLIARARAYARDFSLPCSFEVGDILDTDDPSEKYDGLLLAQGMYSAIPTRSWRIDFLKKAKHFLNQGGVFYLEFRAGEAPLESDWKFSLKKSLAKIMGGYSDLEKGDVVFKGGHFFHLFEGESEFLEEVREAGWKAEEIDVIHQYAVLSIGTKSQ